MVAASLSLVVLTLFLCVLLCLCVSHDGSERAVLDFCTLLHADPELLRCSRVVPGLLLNDEGVVVADECDTATAATDTSQPIDETRMQQYMQTIQQYVSMQESRS